MAKKLLLFDSQSLKSLLTTQTNDSKVKKRKSNDSVKYDDLIKSILVEETGSSSHKRFPRPSDGSGKNTSRQIVPDKRTIKSAATNSQFARNQFLSQANVYIFADLMGMMRDDVVYLERYYQQVKTVLKVTKEKLLTDYNNIHIIHEDNPMDVKNDISVTLFQNGIYLDDDTFNIICYNSVIKNSTKMYRNPPSENDDDDDDPLFSNNPEEITDDSLSIGIFLHAFECYQLHRLLAGLLAQRRGLVPPTYLDSQSYTQPCTSGGSVNGNSVLTISNYTTSPISMLSLKKTSSAQSLLTSRPTADYPQQPYPKSNTQGSLLFTDGSMITGELRSHSQPGTDTLFNASSSVLPPLRTRDLRKIAQKRKLQNKGGFDEAFGRATPRCLRGGDASKSVSLHELRRELQVSKDGLAHLDSLVEDTILWVQNNCDRNGNENIISGRAKAKCKSMAIDRLSNVLYSSIVSMSKRAIIKWKNFINFNNMKFIAIIYSRAKSVEMLSLTLSGIVSRQLLKCWSCWIQQMLIQKRWEQEAAASEIQRVARGRTSRVRVMAMRRQRAAIKIQSLIRMRIARNIVTKIRENIRRNEAAARIQKLLHDNAEINKAKNLRHQLKRQRSCLIIQRVARGNAARKRVLTIKLDYKRKHQSANEVQRLVRGKLARDRVKNIKREKDEEERRMKINNSAAVKIQSYGRKILAKHFVAHLKERKRIDEEIRKRKEKEELERREREERAKRELEERRRREREIAERNGATVIQAIFRQKLAKTIVITKRQEKTMAELREKQRKEEERLRLLKEEEHRKYILQSKKDRQKAAEKLQSLARGRLARRSVNIKREEKQRELQKRLGGKSDRQSLSSVSSNTSKSSDKLPKKHQDVDNLSQLPIEGLVSELQPTVTKENKAPETLLSSNEASDASQDDVASNNPTPLFDEDDEEDQPQEEVGEASVSSSSSDDSSEESVEVSHSDRAQTLAAVKIQSQIRARQGRQKVQSFRNGLNQKSVLPDLTDNRDNMQVDEGVGKDPAVLENELLMKELEIKNEYEQQLKEEQAKREQELEKQKRMRLVREAEEEERRLASEKEAREKAAREKEAREKAELEESQRLLEVKRKQEEKLKLEKEKKLLEEELKEREKREQQERLAAIAAAAEEEERVKNEQLKMKKALEAKERERIAKEQQKAKEEEDRLATLKQQQKAKEEEDRVATLKQQQKAKEEADRLAAALKQQQQEEAEAVAEQRRREVEEAEQLESKRRAKAVVAIQGLRRIWIARRILRAQKKHVQSMQQQAGEVVTWAAVSIQRIERGRQGRRRYEERREDVERLAIEKDIFQHDAKEKESQAVSRVTSSVNSSNVSPRSSIAKPSSDASDRLAKEMDERIKRLEELERSIILENQKREEREKAMERTLKLLQDKAKAEEEEALARQEFLKMAAGPISARSQYESTGPRSDKGTSSKGNSTARGGAVTNPPTARSARESPIPRDAPRVVANGLIWVQLWDPAESAWYWYCQDTQAAQWEAPVGDKSAMLTTGSTSQNPPTARSARESPIPRDAPRVVVDGEIWVQLWDPVENAWYWYCQDTQAAQWEKPGVGVGTGSDVDAGYESGGAMTDYSTDRNDSVDDNTESEFGEDLKGWQEFWDEQAQAKYWYNYETGEATWTKPDLTWESKDSLDSIPVASVGDNWISCIDEETGQEYWYNTVTGETSWT